MTGPVVRLATEDDVPACAAVVNGWIDATEWLPRDFPPEEIERQIREALPDREIWVAGDPVAGYLSFDPSTSRIGGLYVSRPGEGLGKALMDRVKEGRDYIQLWTHRPNRQAQRFYAREGFTATGIEDEGSDGVPEVRMEWRR